MAEKSSIPSGRGNDCFRNSSGSRNPQIFSMVHHKLPTSEKPKVNLTFKPKKKE